MMKFDCYCYHEIVETFSASMDARYHLPFWKVAVRVFRRMGIVFVLCDWEFYIFLGILTRPAVIEMVYCHAGFWYRRNYSVTEYLCLSRFEMNFGRWNGMKRRLIYGNIVCCCFSTSKAFFNMKKRITEQLISRKYLQIHEFVKWNWKNK